MYQSQGNAVYFVHDPRDSRLSAKCQTPADATHAAKLLNRARTLNDVKRQYTAAARLIADAENLPGFVWIEPEYTA